MLGRPDQSGETAREWFYDNPIKMVVSIIFGLVVSVFIFREIGWRGRVSLWIDVANLIVYTVLTVSLIGVYIRMSKVQEEQVGEIRRQADLEREIAHGQKRQTSILSAQQRPRIVTEGRWVKGNDTMILCLSNLGGGPALDLRLRTRLDHNNRDYDGWCRYMRLERLSSNTFDSDGVALDTPRNHLYSGETEVCFEVTVMADTRNIHDGSLWLDSIAGSFRRLGERGIDGVTVEAELDYIDNKEQKYSERVLYYRASTRDEEQDVFSLEEAIANGQRQDRIDSMNQATRELLREQGQ